MTSPQTDKAVANQFIITATNANGSETEFFQSYDTVIAYKNSYGNYVLDVNNWDYSVTTLKYLKEFMRTRDSKAEIAKKIKDGTIITLNFSAHRDF